MKQIVLFLIRCYQLLLSPLLGRHCRFYPTCSAYAYEAIKKYGLLKGILLGTKRLLKCHPFHPGGVDFVP
jgi:putative membrane protein insertion efficiency factor